MVVTMEKSNSAINGSRLKNVAKKSTTRLPGDVMKMRDYSIEASPVSPSTTSNKNSVDRISIFEKITMGINGQNRSVTDGAHKNGVLFSSGKKRLAEAEVDSGSNPAKFARTQIEEIERRHEEMLNTAMSGGVNDADLTVVRDRSAHSNGDKYKTSSEADSSMDVEIIGDNQGSRSLFSLAEKMKDSLKGVIKTAATNIVDRQQPYCISDGEDSEAVSSTSRTEKPAMSVDKVNLFESFSGLAQKVIKQKDNLPEDATLSKDGVHDEVTRAPDIDKSRKADSSGDEDPSLSVEFLASPVPGNGSVEPSLAAKEANDSVPAKAAHGTPCHVESVQVNGADGTEYSVGTKPASEHDSTEYSVGISACGQNVTESAVGSVSTNGTYGTECSESTIPANGTDDTECYESTIPDNGTDGTQCFESIPDNGTDGTQCFESFPANGTDGTQCFESISANGTDGTQSFESIPTNGTDGTECFVASPSVNGTVDTKHPSSPIRAECQSIGDDGTTCSLTNETDGKIKPDNVTDNNLSSVNPAEKAGIEYKDGPVPCGADAALDTGGESEEVDEDLLLGNQDGGGDCQDSVNDDILDIDDPIQSSDDASTPIQHSGQNTDLLGAASVNSHSSQDVCADRPCGTLLSKADTTEEVADGGHVKDSCNQVITSPKMTSDESEDNEGEKEYEKSGVDDVRDTYPSEKTLKARVTDPFDCSNESVEPECETSAQLCSSVRHIDGIQCEEGKEASYSDVDMKTEDKCSLIGDYKSVVSHMETDEDTRSMASSHKRHGSESHTDEEDVGDGKNEAKKTRLDAVIRQLGTHLKSQSDDALDPLSRDVDDGAHDSDHHGTDQIIRIRMKDLEKVILRRMTQYMETNHGSLISSLQRRVADLSSVAQLWQKRAEDLKSKLTAAKILKNSKVVRNMGIQVTEKKVEAAAGGYVKTTTTRRPSSSTPATPSPVNQTLLGTVVNPVASGTVLAPAPSLSLAGGTITLLPHPTPTSSSSPSTRSVKSGSTPLAVPCLTGVIDLTEEEDKKPGQKTAVTSMPSVAAALCSPPSAGAIAQTPGGALLVQQPGGAPLLLQPMAGMTSTAGPLLYTSHPTSFMVQTPATTTSSVLRNPLPISTTLQQQYVVAGSAMTKPPAAAAITTPSTQGQLNQPRPRPAATNQRSIVASAPRILPKQINQPKPSNKPSSQHPAPLPDMPTNTTNAAWKKDPPKPGLKISRVKQGIVLSWNMALTDENAAVVNYQLFAYQETAAPPASNLWKKVGNVKALPLPMACTLTQFQEGNKYHFSVRAIDTHGRMGPFSEPGSIHLKGAVS